MKISKKSPRIRFHCNPTYFGAIPEPYPASKNIPDWFKKLPPMLPTQGPNGFPPETIKSCVPVLDAFSAGYIIPLAGSVRVVVNGDEINTSWRGNIPLVESHSREQVGDDSGLQLPTMKWLNPWSIVLPKGYSAIITAPFNDKNLPFECLTGIVDCDKYTNKVNFPFIWRGPRDGYDDIIKIGTPLVQVIPFKREDWHIDVSAATDEESLDAERIATSVQVRTNGYRDLFRTPKRWTAR